MMSIQETLSLTIIQLLLIFIFPFNETYSQSIHLQYSSQGLEMTSAEGRIVYLQANADDDEDGILNSLEVEGFTYSPNHGLQPWNGDPNQRYFKTDPLRWSTDGDPYSDYMEVS